ncbi:MAG TPA: hypothetical protein VI981_00680 [Candidatus Paceibacterota bacterium]
MYVSKEHFRNDFFNTLLFSRRGVYFTSKRVVLITTTKPYGNHEDTDAKPKDSGKRSKHTWRAGRQDHNSVLH